MGAVKLPVPPSGPRRWRSPAARRQRPAVGQPLGCQTIDDDGADDPDAQHQRQDRQRNGMIPADDQIVAHGDHGAENRTLDHGGRVKFLVFFQGKDQFKAQSLHQAGENDDRPKIVAQQALDNGGQHFRNQAGTGLAPLHRYRTRRP